MAAADGDDYTWSDMAAKAVARMAPALGGAVVMPGSEATCYNLVAIDLRTPDQRERDDVAALHLRCDNLVDALEALTTRVTALERKQRRTVLEQAAGWKD